MLNAFLGLNLGIDTSCGGGYGKKSALYVDDVEYRKTYLQQRQDPLGS